MMNRIDTTINRGGSSHVELTSSDLNNKLADNQEPLLQKVSSPHFVMVYLLRLL